MYVCTYCVCIHTYKPVLLVVFLAPLGTECSSCIYPLLAVAAVSWLLRNLLSSLLLFQSLVATNGNTSKHIITTALYLVNSIDGIKC